MNNKFIYAFGILILLVILYIFNINKQNSYLSSTSQLFDIDKSQIKKILIQSKGDALEIEKIDTSWVISGHDSLNIKMDLLNSFFDRVLSLESETIMTKNENKWSTYNVDDSLGTHIAIIDYNDNPIGYYVFGKSNSDYMRCYVRKNKFPEVHLANNNVMYNLQVRPEYWGEKPAEDISPPQNN